MPQLNPSPWMLIFILVWMALLVYTLKMPQKDPNTPPMPRQTKKPTSHWQWP
nr:ATP synthase F0 subunit 8 [Loxopholis percarinatum]QUQ05596.1 ATP synthase F0 subunit 8 [Loxopholis percarinatum]